MPAKNPAQIRKMLKHEAQLVEKKDSALNVIAGEYEVVIPHTITTDKKTITQNISIDAKIAAMAASDEDKNLFSSSRVPGTGHNQGSGGGNNQGGAQVSAATKIARGMSSIR